MFCTGKGRHGTSEETGDHGRSETTPDPGTARWGDGSRYVGRRETVKCRGTDEPTGLVKGEWTLHTRNPLLMHFTEWMSKYLNVRGVRVTHFESQLLTIFSKGVYV